MSSLSTSPPARRPRAPRVDAARNRVALLDAARDAFSDDDADASLEAIARAAGVGIGTLYRNFPTREDLVAAVYATELDAVIAAADPLLRTKSPDQALRAWTDRYAAFVATKRGMAESLRAGALVGAAAANHTRERVNSVIGAFLAAGTETGVFRTDVQADDVTTALVGFFLATRDSPDPAQTSRLLDLLIDGLHPRP
ncbi:TetR/AcrR family transcriptional regulator [Herbiconiux ginsengi]|uniref:Transcriptional regulator, TetR family n=1 Tax=Herbiconiux ginsengi TaxID=381665 RepID=A0A1H3QQS9_9MICO|nr:TetR/AcrR family transcriptional regulator [Herbiconiux ginsengi]SDZ15355.1 transcriptional regulator, TetR family [Herbiconiux ginsengi]